MNELLAEVRMNLISAALVSLAEQRGNMHMVAIYLKKKKKKMHDAHVRTYTHIHMHTHRQQLSKCQRSNELLIREYAPERSPALINFVPASDEESRRNLVNLVSVETSSLQTEVAMLGLCETVSSFIWAHNQS